jgi:hypothetical protein
MALRIRDDVDLKELEKFGFLIDKSGFCEKILEGDGDSQISINITHNRFINIDIQYGEWQGSSTLYEQLTILYDLIKANLVVKE